MGLWAILLCWESYMFSELHAIYVPVIMYVLRMFIAIFNIYQIFNMPIL